MKSFFSFAISWLINLACIVFVAQKSTECLIKFIDQPQGTKLDIKNAAKIDQFPRITICAVDADKKEKGLRWNLTHLHHCGIAGYGL